jgi:tRNA(His) guanylyltransferase
MNDELGNRIKSYYEDPARVLLPRKTWVIVRVDGKNFHTFTRTMERPYCRPLADALDHAALFLAGEMAGCVLAYGQSDEYSFLLSDFGRDDSRMWFDGSVQKIASVSASLFTAAFHRHYAEPGYAAFDARVFAIPHLPEVIRYFDWRQADASRNSLNMLASHYYSHEELLNKTAAEKHDLIHAKGDNWAKWPADFKRGRMVRREGLKWMVDLEIPVFPRQPEFLTSILRQSSA